MASSARNGSGRFFGRVPKVRRAFEWPANISVRGPWMDGNVARGNLPIFLCIVAISLINQTPFSGPSSRRSKVLSLSGTLREKFFAFEIGNRGFQSLFNLEPVLYIFVERGEDGNKFQRGRKYWRESIICRKGNYGLFALGQLFIQLRRRGRYFVARREISYEEEGKGSSPLRNSGLSANFLIAFRVSWLRNRFEFVFRP